MDAAKAPSPSTLAALATPLTASKSIMAPPDPAAGKLVGAGKPRKPRHRDANSRSGRCGTCRRRDGGRVPARRRPPLQHTEFGVDLGGANSVAGLRALWRGLLKTRANAPVVALQPIIVIKEGANGLGMQLRLVAGPLHDAGAAAKICAVLGENQSTLRNHDL